MTATDTQPEVLALIPAFREARFIHDVVTRSLAQTRPCVVVDDGSDDDTAARARAAGATVLSHGRNRGKGAAIKTGLEWFLRDCPHPYCVLLDGDGQHAPEEIARFREAAANDPCRLFVGNRMADTRAMPWIRRLVNRYMSWEISRICGRRIPDSQCGFRMVHRDLAPHLLAAANAFDYETEMLFLASMRGERIASVPVSTIYGDETSKIRPLRDTVAFFQLLARYRRRLG